ncbi:hypothetical protein D9758_016152 [Tetrapyrgos nigripes]|uniref:Uncharacterized protein n=1 Tax=Tetrapyrgos nigripes TaxID=182062 RepID=A0A8H5FIB5_9AGAR|nr:hypothetical protein D9758_016152 [Tetrapyrgos nigripes]
MPEAPQFPIWYTGRLELVYEIMTAGFTIQSLLLNNKNKNMTQPSKKVFSNKHQQCRRRQGGGSCLTFVNGLFRAGSESAGAGAELGPRILRLGRCILYT